MPSIFASRKFKSVSAGKYHTCGILEDYTVQCWGASGEGSEFNVGQVMRDYPCNFEGAHGDSRNACIFRCAAPPILQHQPP